MSGNILHGPGVPAGADKINHDSKIQHPRVGIGSLAVERYLLARLLDSLGISELAFVLWDNRTVSPPSASPSHRLFLRDRSALWLLLIFPEYYLPEMYCQGRLLVEGDLEQCLVIVQGARLHADPGDLKRRLACILFRPSADSLRRARENIHHHYDLGNDFYRLWLDRRMLYTCAYYPQPHMSLEQAQLAKMDHVCRKLRLRPGERVVEAGCGWGALALHMARHYGVTVRAFNISQSQLALARETARDEGLEHEVEFVDADYREIDGEYDAFVSVGMLEHVGPRQYPDLGRIMDRCLAPHGRGLVHTIGTDRPGPLNSWIERRIFPGAHPPALEEMTPMFGSHGFSVLDVENLRLHYARTLAHWRERFEAAIEQVLAMYDPQFVRTWQFYLASSQASFQVGQLQLFQVLVARKGFNDIPWSREYIYRHADL